MKVPAQQRLPVGRLSVDLLDDGSGAFDGTDDLEPTFRRRCKRKLNTVAAGRFRAGEASRLENGIGDAVEDGQRLGIVNDTHVAEGLLLDWSRAERKLSHATTLAIGAWIGHQRERRHRAETAFDAAWRAFARHPFVARNRDRPGELVLGDGRYSFDARRQWCHVPLDDPGAGVD